MTAAARTSPCCCPVTGLVSNSRSSSAKYAPPTSYCRLRAAIRERIDNLEDQVRRYPTTTQTFAERYIIGARTVEERADYWIVR
jgi:hypothetical protein